MPDKKAERPEGQMRRRPMRRRKKVCAFCADANKALDYKLSLIHISEPTRPY